MQTNGVTSSTQAFPSTSSTTSTSSAATTGTANAMDTSQFMKLLLTQLTHQNPLEPMSDSEMMSQYSSLNSLEELRSIHTSMDAVSSSNQTTYLASLLGKTVKVNQANGNPVTGVVDGVIIENKIPKVQIGSQTLAASDILEIHGAAA